MKFYWKLVVGLLGSGLNNLLERDLYASKLFKIDPNLLLLTVHMRMKISK
ncbi:MAG TPA: hypothetical protein GXX37_04805 [Clostridiaceae bacterium]|nr:hypothetical protein [Clostridiaceae bacterium]